MMGMDVSSRSGRGPARYLRRCGARCSIGTGAVASRAADCRSVKAITCATGRTAARPCCRTSRCSAAGTTARCTRRAIRSSAGRTARCSFGVRTASRCPRSRLRPRYRADPGQALRATHVANGLHLHATTLRAGWLGEKLDVGWAIDVLHPLAAAPRCVTSPDANGGEAAWQVWSEHHRGSRLAILGDPTVGGRDCSVSPSRLTSWM